MPVVRIPFDNLEWPRRCCRCGNADYGLRKHNEKVLTRTLLSVSEYREVTLTIPVCPTCARMQWLWFGAAIVCAAAGTMFLWPTSTPNDVSAFVLWLFVAAVVLAWVGVYQRPLRVLGFNDQMRLLTVRIYDGETAAHMAGLTEALIGNLRSSGKHMECTRCGDWVEAPRGSEAGTFRCPPCTAKRRRRMLIVVAIVLAALAIVAIESGWLF